MDCCSKIGELFSSILDAIRPILAIVLVCLAVYFAWWAGPSTIAWVEALPWMPAFAVGLSGPALGLIAFGAALIVDTDTTLALVEKGVEVVSRVAGSIVGAVATGVSAGLFGQNGLTFLMLGVGAYLYLTRDKKDTTTSAENKKGDKNDSNESRDAKVA